MGKPYKISPRNSEAKYAFSWIAENFECRQAQEIFSSFSVRPARLWNLSSVVFNRCYGFFSGG